jgi:SAM-dependent methyltransferase
MIAPGAKATATTHRRMASSPPRRRGGRSRTRPGYPLDGRDEHDDALPFADESFDYVLSWNVIFHGTMGDVGRRVADIWRVLKPGGLYQGTMLSKRDAQFGRGRPVASDTFIRGSDPKAHPHYYCDLAGLAALRRLRTAVADPGGAAPTRLLALAHPRRTPVNRDGRVTGAGERSSPLSIAATVEGLTATARCGASRETQDVQ